MIKMFFVMLLIFPSISEATTCVKDYAGTASCVENENTAGDCETLGYLTKDVSGCTNYLYCPFNTNYKKCVASGEIDCTELGFTTTDKSSWCTDIVECPTDASYTACTTQEELNCAELGYTSENKAAWCSNIITCPNNNTLTACVGQCVYNDICVDKIDEATASMPSQFAQLQFEDCTACGETGQVVTGWKCNDGYIRANDVYMVVGSFDYYSCEGGKRPTSSSAADCCINCTVNALVSGTITYIDANGSHQVKTCK